MPRYGISFVYQETGIKISFTLPTGNFCNEISALHQNMHNIISTNSFSLITNMVDLDRSTDLLIERKRTSSVRLVDRSKVQTCSNSDLILGENPL